jgi:nitroreductase
MIRHILRTAAIRSGMALLACISLTWSAQDSAAISLPKPQTDIGKPLMQVLKERKSTREFAPEKLSMQQISNLLWAAFGINRPETGGRTAPSAMNKQEIDVYIALPEAIWLYEAKENALRKIVAGDFRGQTGRQAFVKDAPANIILVADYRRSNGEVNEQSRLCANADASYISENIYLYCASEGLATVVRASVDKENLAKAMNLGEKQEIIFAQSVGYPKK